MTGPASGAPGRGPLRALALPVAAAVLATAACGSAATSAGPGPAAGTATHAGVAPAGPAPDRGAWLRRAVSLVPTLVVRAEPRFGSAVVSRLARKNSLGSPTVLLAVQRRAGWIQVELPVRPNGSTGWVQEEELRLEPVSSQIEIDLSTRRIRIWLAERALTDAVVGIGSVRNPTPTGRFYVTDRVRPTRLDGPYGAFALGLSAHSPTLTEFAGADGQVGIHGTNDPGSIGQAVSHGCIRVPASVTAVLARVPLGTPVVIR